MSDDREDIGTIFSDTKRMEAAVKRGVREALLRHKKLGESIYGWQDERVVEIPAAEIQVYEDGDGVRS